MIKIKKLSKEFANGQVALKDIDLFVGKGEFIYIVGPSGAGKSTLLNLIFRKDKPTNGEIFIDNYSLSKLDNRSIPLLRRNIGMIFQDFKLLNKRTVFENVAFALKILGYSRLKIKQQVTQVLELVSMSEKVNCFPAELSGGEQQRVCIARAIVNNPKLLLADEPTGSLDPDTSWEIMQLLSKINQRNTTVIVSTHDKGTVDDIRKRVVALDKGYIIRDQQLGSYD
ncbi:cell division ATP-binding protein FtsE [Candidatus Marinamargulisbacteria bacterium SCGC AG-414-C22]|nr:cell division ATP-binding protein FtsE [Candidatus Marinamargulisbacteria bacterium SCGC AG-414-C22]